MMTFTVTKHRHTRFWAVRDEAGELVCVCVYKRRALEVVRRLAALDGSAPFYLRDGPPALAVNPAEISRGLG